jgi:hypothetical protein
MPSVLVSGLRVSVEYREPYVSQALNEKNSAIPRGIIRGGYLKPSGNPDEVLIAVDPMTSETVINAAGVPSIAGGYTNVYPVTYRTDADVPLSIPVDGVLHFICLIGGYTPLSTTSAEIRDYTEAEFEAGTMDSDGGVLLGVVQANAVAGVIPANQVMLSGMSNGTLRPFRAATADAFVSSQGGAIVRRERVAVQMDFGSLSAKRVAYQVAPSYFSDPGTVFDQESTITPTGNGSVRFAPVGADLAKTVVMYGDASIIPISTTLPRKVRFEMIYRTSAGYVPNASCYISVGAITAGGTALLSSPLIAPTIPFPQAASTDWSLFVTEIDVPQTSGGNNVLSFIPICNVRLDAGEIEISSISAILPGETGNPSELVGADGTLTPVPSSYGSVAGSPDFSLASSPSVSVGALALRRPGDSTGWIVRSTPSQDMGAGVGQSIYFVPENAVSASDGVFFGASQVVDAENVTPVDRYTNVSFLGDNQGATANFAVSLDNIPLKADELRPNNGFGGDPLRIEVRDASGATSSPPAFISSQGTACLTAVVERSGGNWVLNGPASNYLNCASVTSTSGTEFSVNLASLIVPTTAVAFATYKPASGAASSRYCQIGNLLVNRVDVLINGGSASASDIVMVCVIGRFS